MVCLAHHAKKIVMDLDRLRSLVAVSDAGAITEAANRLGLTNRALPAAFNSLKKSLVRNFLAAVVRVRD